VPIPVVSYFIHLWSVLQAFRRIVSRGFQPHVIHAHIYEAAFPATLVGRLHNIPVVVTEHTSEFPRQVLTRSERWRAHLGLGSARIVMPVSRFLQRSIEAYGLTPRFAVVPNVVDTGLFSPKAHAGVHGSPRRLLVVGLLDASPIKGLTHLFDALRRLKMKRNDWHLDVVGDGPGREEYEHLVQQLGLSGKVTFCGLKSKEEVAPYMRQADLFVLPSLLETFSVVTAEALATGTRVLTTRCGGPEECVKDDVGLAVAGALCEGLEYVFDHLKDFSPAHISDYAAQRFGPESVGRQIQEVYLACLTRHAHDMSGVVAT
jgi:glycosyltransferase involved in cell wall biosynthesis